MKEDSSHTHQCLYKEGIMTELGNYLVFLH